MAIEGLFEIFSLIENSKSTKFHTPLLQSPYVYAAIRVICDAIAAIPIKFIRDPAFKSAEFRTRFSAIYYSLDPQHTPEYKAMEIIKLHKGYLSNKSFCKTYGIINSKARLNLEEVFGHPLAKVINNPNPEMTRSQLFQATYQWYLHDGQSFWVLERNDAGDITEIWPKSKFGFKPKIEKGNLTHWTFTGNRTEDTVENTDMSINRDIEVRDIVRFYKVHPNKMFDGLAPAVPANAELRQDFLASLFNTSFFENGAEARLWLLSEDTIPASKKRELEEQLEKRHGGPTAGNKTTVLDNGLKPVPGSTHSDMQFMDQKKWSRDVVLAIYRTPKSVIGGLESDESRSKFSEVKTAFFEMTIIPELVYASDNIHKNLLAEDSPDTFMLFDLAQVSGLRGSLLEISEAATNFLKAGFSRNEVNRRYQLGFEDATWGNEAYGNGALVPYSKLKDAMPASLVGDASSQANETEEPTNPEGDSRQAKAIRKARTSFNWAKFVEEIFIPHENEFGTSYIGILNRLEREQKKRLSPSRKNIERDDIERILFDLQVWANILQGVPQKVGADAVETAIKSVATDLGGVFIFNATDPTILGSIESSASRIRGIAGSIRAKVRAQLELGIAQNETILQISLRLEKIFSLERNRALSIARTEVAQLISKTRFEAFRVEGVKKKIWSTAQDEEVRKTHRVYGRTSAKRMDFNYLELTGGGGTLLFPSDPLGPASEVVNCRCVELAQE